MVCNMGTIWGRYPFQGDFDDYSGNGRDLTNAGGVGFGTDRDGTSNYAASFDQSATNDRLDSSTNITLGSVFTIAWQHYMSDTTGNTVLCVGNHNSGDTVLIGSQTVATGKMEAYIRVGGSSAYAAESVQLSTSTWYSYVVTYDGSNIRLYKDKVLQATVALSVNMSSGFAFKVGSDSDNLNRLNGKVSALILVTGTAWDQDTIDAYHDTYPTAACPVSGYANNFMGVSSANIGKVMGVETANISKIMGS